MDFDFSGFQTVHLDKNNGSILREKRVVLGLTQKQVAEQAKITLRQYQKFENSERNIMTCSFQMACRIIEALDMNISDFYVTVQSPPNKTPTASPRKAATMASKEETP